MALNDLTGSNGGETGSSGRSCFFFFFSVELFPREMLSVHVWKTFPAALISPPHTTSHISSASPVRMFSSDTKIKTVGISPFCFHTVLHWKIRCFFLIPHFFFFLFFLILDVLFVDPELVSVCSYMCWASIMSKYLASMIWGSTLFLNTEQTEFTSVVTC